MAFVNLNRMILKGGLSIAAALLLSTAAFAQDATAGDGATDPGVVQDGHDLAPGNEGIAVGEPDPTVADDSGTAIDDGTDVTVEDGADGSTADDGTDVTVEDGTDGSTADDGTDVTVDDGTDGSTADDGTDITVDDGADISTVEDGTVQNWHDLNPGADGEGIAVGEPDPNGGGSDDGTIVVVYDGGLTDPAADTSDDGPVILHTMNGGPDVCIDCNVAMADIPGKVGRPGKHAVVERKHNGKADPAVVPVVSVVPAAPLVSVAPVVSGGSEGSDDVAMVATSSMAKCMSEHSRSTWICEWQNGAGQ